MYIETTDKLSYTVFGQSDITIGEDKITLDGKGNRKHVIAECPAEYAPAVVAALARLDAQDTPLATQETLAKILRNAGYEQPVEQNQTTVSDAPTG